MNKREFDLGSADAVEDFHAFAARQAEDVVDARLREFTYQYISD